MTGTKAGNKSYSQVTPRVWLPAVRASSGADIFTQRLAEALNRRGIRAEITWLPHRAEYAPWSVKVPRPPAWANVVHINSWLSRRFIPTSLPIIATVHLVVHDSTLAPYKTWPQSVYHNRWIKRVETNALSQTAAITTVSAYTGKQVQYVFGSKDIVTIPNWIDTDLFKPRQKLSSHKPFRLLYIGNWSRRKGVDLLPLVMRRLGPGFELHFATGTRLKNISRDLPANMINLGELRHAEEVICAYQAADALLFPSRLEGFSLAVLEAQACGIPVIAATISSLPELVIDGITGILCPSDDVEAFATAARTLASNPALRKTMSEAAREKVVQNFSEPVLVAQYIECYRRALNRI